MSCGSCSTLSVASAKGCQNNGVCGSGGCNKMNSYDWLGQMVTPGIEKPFNIYEISFKGGRKSYYRNSNNLSVFPGDPVIVESQPGYHLGYISLGGELVRLQMKKYKVDEQNDVKNIYRIATKFDLDKWIALKESEQTALVKGRQFIDELKMDMKLTEVEYQADRKKITFYFTSEERVDFRELIKKLHDSFGSKIEMRQISPRQEAGRLGGIGTCGRELCCSTWLTDFKTVSTNAARYQNLSLNPSKLQGQCGRLKCCLNYELETYLDALRDIPNIDTNLSTNFGELIFIKTDIFKRIMWFSIKGETNWHPIPVDQVVKIIEMNKKGETPDINDLLSTKPEVNTAQDYGTFEEYNINRMDGNKKKKKHKNKRHWGNRQ